MHYSTQETCSTLHREHMHYITQETHALHYRILPSACAHYYTVKVDISSQDKHIPKIAKLTRKGPKYINTSVEKMN